MSDQVTRFEARRRQRRAESTATLADIDRFKTRLATRSHDRYYQPIPFPNGDLLPGYERTARTLDYLLAHVDFEDKTVLDAGCYHCYTTFGVEDAGARAVTGVDRSLDAIETARDLAALWGYPTTLVHADLDTWVPPMVYDIILCCNVVHHAKAPQRVIEQLFQHGTLLIWEAPQEIADLCAVHTTHQLVHVADGARTPDLGRRFYHYQRKAW